MDFTFAPIGIIRSCFKEKFGIPRQPGLAPLARGRLELLPPYDDPAALDGLESCSHIWIQFVFHANKRSSWKARVKPPRLGGNKTLGVFATRSPLRPNPIGLSVVRLTGVIHRPGKSWLELSGIDLLDGTPVLDIKPYLPYVDCLPTARNQLAPAPPRLLPVTFSGTAEQQAALLGHEPEKLRDLIVEILQQDPRPSYHQSTSSRIYGMALLDLNVRWQYLGAEPDLMIRVVDLVPQKENHGR